MVTDTINQATQKAEAASEAASEAVDSGAVALNEAIAAAEKVFIEGAKRADKLFRDGERQLKDNLERLRDQAKTYGETAGQSVEEAQRYVIDQVKERPLVATLTGLGIGFFVGVLLSGRKR